MPSKRRRHAVFIIAVAMAFMSFPLLGSSAVANGGGPDEKVFVCKYVGTPNVDERLQTGQNPISVSVNSIPNYQGPGSYFADQHGRSYVLKVDDTAPGPAGDPDVSECPPPDGPPDQCPDGTNPGDLNGDGVADAKDCGYEPPTVVPIPVQETVDPCNPAGVSNNVDWRFPLPGDSDKIDWSVNESGTTRTATLQNPDDKWSDGTATPKVFNLPADSGVLCDEPDPPTVVQVPTQDTLDPCNPAGVSNNVAWKNPPPGDTTNIDWSESNNGATRTATLIGSNVEWSDGTTAPKVFNLPADSGVLCDEPVEPEGDITVTSDCESITINPPTGVKPEGGTIVILLDGNDARPETWTVTPGVHTVELFVNGELVDSETVTVAACPPEEKVTICHATSAVNNPYVQQTVSVNAVDGVAGNSGNDADHYGEHKGPIFDPAVHQNGDDWGDIIPPVPPHHSGLNWDAEGQAIYDNDCKVPDEPQPAEPTVKAVAGACVNPGEKTGVVDVTVTNTDDETDDTVTYDVTLDGTTKQVTIADGDSGSVQFTGLAAGSYTVSVSGDDGTSASTTVKVEECEVPPEPAEPTVQAAAEGCVDEGASNGVVNVVVTNTDDESVTYQVTLDGTTKSVTIDDGSSDTLEFTGIQPGTYTVSVVGDDDTSTSTTVKVEECEEPPVYNPDGSVNSGCLGNARWVLDNRDSNQPVFFEITVAEERTSSIRLVRVNAGDRKVIRMHGLKPGTVLTLGVLDVRLDREVVPGECDGDNPPPDNPNPPPTGTPNNPTFADTGMGGENVPTAASGQMFYYGLSAAALLGLLMVGLGFGLRLRGRRVEASV